MNKQRKVLITVTYNEMGIIIDTKAEEVTQPNLQPTCNQLATDTISRRAAIEAIMGLPTWWADGGGYYGGAQPPMEALLDPEDAVSAIENLPSAQPEIVRCKECKYWKDSDGVYRRGFDAESKCPLNLKKVYEGTFYCGMAERRTDENNNE